MSISKEQWLAIENHLVGSFVSVKFKLGQHDMSVQRARKSESTTVLAVYIDGKIKGAWFDAKNDRPGCIELVWRKREKSYYTAAEIKRLEKAFGKRDAKKYHPKLLAKHHFLDCYFTTAKSVVRQFKKISNLELMLIGGAPYQPTET